MGHAGGEEPDASQPFGSHELAAALRYLAVEIGGDSLKAAGHFIEGIRQLGHFAASLQLQAVTEVSLRDPPRSLVQLTDRVEDPDVSRTEQAGEEDEHDGRGKPDSHERRAVD